MQDGRPSASLWGGLPSRPTSDAFAPGQRIPLVLGLPPVTRRPLLRWGSIGPGSLRRRLERLLEQGCHLIDFETFLLRLESPTVHAHAEVLVTTRDSGVDAMALAWPVFEDLDISPALFVRTVDVGRARVGRLPGTTVHHLSWSELRYLAEQGLSIQSRGHHGLHAAVAAPEKVFGDLVRSRREIEKRLDLDALALDYPASRPLEDDVDLAHRAGFVVGFAAGLRGAAERAMAISVARSGCIGFRLRPLRSRGDRSTRP